MSIESRSTTDMTLYLNTPLSQECYNSELLIFKKQIYIIHKQLAKCILKSKSPTDGE